MQRFLNQPLQVALVLVSEWKKFDKTHCEVEFCDRSLNANHDNANQFQNMWHCEWQEAQ